VSGQLSNVFFRYYRVNGLCKDGTVESWVLPPGLG